MILNAMREQLQLGVVSNNEVAVCEGCKFDKKCNLQDQGRYKEICSHFEQTDY